MCAYLTLRLNLTVPRLRHRAACCAYWPVKIRAPGACGQGTRAERGQTLRRGAGAIKPTPRHSPAAWPMFLCSTAPDYRSEHPRGSPVTVSRLLWPRACHPIIPAALAGAGRSAVFAMLMKRLQRCPGPAAHPWLCPPLGHCAPHSDQRCLSVHAAKPEASWQLSQHESGSAVGPRSPCQPSTSGRVAWHPRTMRPYSTAPSQRDVTTQASSRSSGSDPAPAAVASTQPAASSPQGAQQQSSQQPAQSRVVRYSPLHYNVEDFVQRIELSEDERKQKQNIVDM